MVLLILLLPIVSASEWDDKETMETCGLVLQYSVPWIIGIILLTTLTTCNRGGSSEAVWLIFSFIQYVRWFGLINIGQNPGFHHFMSKLNNMFDWYQLYDGKDSSRVDEHMFKVYGLQRASFLRNADEMLLMMLGCIVAFILVMILHRFKKHKFIDKLKSLAKYSLLIRMTLISCCDILLYSWLQLKYVISIQTKWDSGLEFFSNILCISFIVTYLVLFFSIPFIINYLSRVEKNFIPAREQFASLVEGYDLLKPEWRLYYYYVYMLNRFVTSMVYMFLYYTPKLVLSILITFQSLTVFYMILARPYYNPKNHKWPIMMEANTLLILSLMTIYLDDNYSVEQKSNVNIVIVLLVYFGVVIGLAKYVINQLRPGAEQVFNEPATVLEPKDLDITCDDKSDNTKSTGLNKITGFYIPNQDPNRMHNDEMEDNAKSQKPNQFYGKPKKKETDRLRVEDLDFDYSDTVSKISKKDKDTPQDSWAYSRPTSSVLPSRPETPASKFYHSLKNKKNKKA